MKTTEIQLEQARRRFVQQMTVRQLLDTFKYKYSEQDEAISYYAGEVLDWMANSDTGSITKLETKPATVPSHIAVAALEFAIEVAVDCLPDEIAVCLEPAAA